MPPRCSGPAGGGTGHPGWSSAPPHLRPPLSATVLPDPDHQPWGLVIDARGPCPRTRMRMTLQRFPAYAATALPAHPHAHGRCAVSGSPGPPGTGFPTADPRAVDPADRSPDGREVGWSDPSYLAPRFKAYFGLSASTYRACHRHGDSQPDYTHHHSGDPARSFP